MAKKSNSQKLQESIEAGGARFSAYFEQFGILVCEHSFLRAALAFGFHLVETAHHRILYGGLCREHGTDTALTRTAVDSQYMTRDMFRQLYQAVFAKKFPETLESTIKISEGIRDKLIHGKTVTDTEIWKAIFNLVEYAAGLNKEVWKISEFEPFGDMRGVTSRRDGPLLDKRTTRWLLKGMSFSLA